MMDGRSEGHWPLFRGFADVNKYITIANLVC